MLLAKLVAFPILLINFSSSTVTTPPKTILRSALPTLGEAGFVPAANLHLGLRSECVDECSQLLSSDSLDRYTCSAVQAELASTATRERCVCACVCVLCVCVYMCMCVCVCVCVCVHASLVSGLTSAHVLRVVEKEPGTQCLRMCQIALEKWGDWIPSSLVHDIMM